MIRINSINNNGHIVLEKSFTGNIILNSYDDKTFDGARLTLTKEQAKELVNEIQLLIYESED